MTCTEIARTKNEDKAKRDAERMNNGAFPGQRYTVETIDASLFTIVLHDADAMGEQPMLTRQRTPRRTFDNSTFTSLAGTQTRGKMRGSYGVFA